MDTIAAAGRFGGGGTAANKDAQRARILQALEKLGVSNRDMEAVRKADTTWVAIDYTHGIMNRYLAGEPDLDAKQVLWTEFWDKYQDNYERPDPVTLKSFLTSIRPPETWRLELLKDYEHYLSKGLHRRPDIWAARRNWDSWTVNAAWPS